MTPRELENDALRQRRLTWEAMAKESTEDEITALLTVAKSLANGDTAEKRRVLTYMAKNLTDSLATMLIASICELSTRRRELQVRDRN